MQLTGEITPGSSFFCPHCGALYAVTLSQRREIASGLAKCVVCERTMGEWKSTLVPAYKLVHRPEAAWRQGRIVAANLMTLGNMRSLGVRVLDVRVPRVLSPIPARRRPLRE